MTQIDHVPHCPICGHYLSTAVRLVSQCCLDPAHWLAAGQLSSRDYFAMAQLAAARFKIINRAANEVSPVEILVSNRANSIGQKGRISEQT